MADSARLPDPPPPLPDWKPSRDIQLREVDWLVHALTGQLDAEVRAGRLDRGRADERLAVWAAIRETVQHG